MVTKVDGFIKVEIKGGKSHHGKDTFYLEYLTDEEGLTYDVIVHDNHPEMSGAEKDIIKTLELFPNANQKTVVEQADLNQSTVSRTLKRLVESGIVVREGRLYRLAEDNF
jgi:DNA-binding MarR family transcriptional regulator